MAEGLEENNIAKLTISLPIDVKISIIINTGTQIYLVRKSELRKTR